MSSPEPRRGRTALPDELEGELNLTRGRRGRVQSSGVRQRPQILVEDLGDRPIGHRDNAIKYSPERASISVRVAAEEDATVIAITDNGPGIAEAHHPRIFDRFYRVDAGRSREMGGVGLGLAIAQWAVAANGGRIELRSSEGQGSIFRIILPRHSTPTASLTLA